MTPMHAITKWNILFPWKKIAPIIDDTTSATSTTRSPPPIMVKSYFVYRANRVSANTTTEVMPTAARTASMSDDAAMTPMMKPSTIVKVNSRM